MTRATTWYKPGITDKFYPTMEDMVQEIVGMLKNEVKALIEGVDYIQLDSLRYVIQLADPNVFRQMASQDFNKALDETIAIDNETLRDAKGSGVTVGLHMCRAHSPDIEYDPGKRSSMFAKDPGLALAPVLRHHW